MPQLPISGSSNITSLDSKIIASLCDGNFHIDTSPTIYLAGGNSTSGGVQGASVQIVNPVGVTIKQYPTSGFDIYPPMTSVVDFPIPLIANVFQYGNYIISVRLTDEDGTNYVVTKTINLCPADSKNKNKNEGCLSATLKGYCNKGTFVAILNNVPTYKGKVVTSQVNDITLEYPSGSGLDNLDTSLNSFSVSLFEGQYKLSGSVCALYDYGDNVFFNVKYKVKCEKIIRCVLDECCIVDKLAELNLKANTDCTPEEKSNMSSLILNAIFLWQLAKSMENCGEDPSDVIGQLEDILGCTCTCNCNESTPINTNSEVAGYIYRGLLTQNGTNPPTAKTSSLNTVAIVWSYNSVGNYIGTITGLPLPLTIDNTFVLITQGYNALSANNAYTIKAGYNSPDSIIILTKDMSNTFVNSVIFNVPIELGILR